ncbi:hypothetical protein [Botryobacter ruber]|nr:hypothetical protein [Botryobacter ruber]
MANIVVSLNLLILLCPERSFVLKQLPVPAAEAYLSEPLMVVMK